MQAQEDAGVAVDVREEAERDPEGEVHAPPAPPHPGFGPRGRLAPVRVDGLTWMPPSVPSPPPRGVGAPPLRGRVVEALADRLIVELEMPVAVGTLVEMRRPGSSERGGREPVARGVVERPAGTGMWWVQLEPNTVVTPELEVRTRQDRGGPWLLPPLPLNTAQIETNVRAFLPVGEGAHVGFMGDLAAGFLIGCGGDVGIRTRVRLDSIGVVIGPEPLPFSGMTHGYVSFVSSFVELGLGLGASIINGPQVSTPAGWRRDRQIAFSIAPHLRLGNEDGLSLRFAMHAVLAGRPGMEGWAIGDIFADLRFPVGHGVGLIARGSGGYSGLFSWDIGARIRLHGNGLWHTWFLTVAAGIGLAVIDQYSSTGPLLSVGIEHRM